MPFESCIRLFLTTVLLCTLNGAAIAGWVKLGAADNGDTLYIDSNSISQTSPLLNEWQASVLLDLPNGARDSRTGQNWESEIYEMKMSCIGNGSIRLNTVFFYTNRMGKGGVIGRARGGDWRSPDTGIFPPVWKHVCCTVDHSVIPPAGGFPSAWLDVCRGK